MASPSSSSSLFSRPTPALFLYFFKWMTRSETGTPAGTLAGTAVVVHLCPCACACLGRTAWHLVCRGRRPPLLIRHTFRFPLSSFMIGATIPQRKEKKNKTQDAFDYSALLSREYGGRATQAWPLPVLPCRPPPPPFLLRHKRTVASVFEMRALQRACVSVPGPVKPECRL